MLTAERGRVGPSPAFMRISFPPCKDLRVLCTACSHPRHAPTSAGRVGDKSEDFPCYPCRLGSVGRRQGLRDLNEDESILSHGEVWLELAKEGRR